MLTFLFFSAMAIAAVTFGAVVFGPLLIIGAAIWVITLPFRLVFGLIAAVFAIIGAVLFAPFRLLRRIA